MRFLTSWVGNLEVKAVRNSLIHFATLFYCPFLISPHGLIGLIGLIGLKTKKFLTLYSER